MNQDSDRERLQTYFDHAPDAIFSVDSSGDIVVSNARAADMFGYAVGELRGQSIDMLVPDSVREDHPSYRRSYFDAPSPRPMGEGAALEARRKDGSTFPVDISLEPIQVNGSMEVIVAVRDISQRKGLERDVSRYHGAFEKAFDAMVIADDSGRYTDVNESACEMFGLDREALLGRRISDFAPPDFDFDSAWAEFQGSEMERGLFPLVTATGEHRYVEYAATLNIVPGEHLSVLRDVTEREERNRQLRVLETVLRHNLRNNMNIIQGYASSLVDVVDEDEAWMVQRLLSTSDELLEKVDKAREIAKVLGASPEVTTLDLVEIVESLVTTVRENHDVDVDLDLPDSALVRATPALESGIAELLENAIEFSEESVPTIGVSIETAENDITLHVSDRGPGIPTMETDILTGAEEVNPLFHGSGFGLWFVHLVVSQSQGRLTFAENEPAGSIVTIWLRSADHSVSSGEAESAGEKRTS